MKHLKYAVLLLAIYSCSNNKSERSEAENSVSEAPSVVVSPPVKVGTPVSDTLAAELKDLYDYENLDSAVIPDLKKLHRKYAAAPFHALLDGKRYFIVSTKVWNYRIKHFDGSTLYGIVNYLLEPVLPVSYEKIFNPDMTLTSCFEIKTGDKIGLFNYRTGHVLEPQFDYIYPGLNGDTGTAFGLKEGIWFQINSDLSATPAPDFNSFEQLRKLSFDISRVPRSKIMLNSYSEFYEEERIGDGKGVLVPPSYIEKLNLSGLGYYDSIILSEQQGEIFGTDKATITKSEERSITDKIRSFFVSFYEEGIDARGYHNKSSQLVVHNEQNEAVNSVPLIKTDQYDYFCKEGNYQFVNDSIVETRYNDTGTFYRFETRYKYHKIGFDGSITTMVSNRYFNFTKFTLIEERHLKGCFAREIESPVDDYNFWKYDHLSIEELDIMRNEIFADYGYKFKTEKWQKYFKKRSWYKPLYDDVNPLLSEIDKANVRTILGIKESMTGREKIVVNKRKAIYVAAG